MNSRFFAKRYLAQVYQKTGRPELTCRTAEEARDLVERIGLGALRGDVEARLEKLPEVPYGRGGNQQTSGTR